MTPAGAAKNRPWDRWLLLAIAFYLAGITLIWTYWRQSRSALVQMSNARVELVELRGLFSLIADAETGQRGYLISGDEKYLEHYESALNELPAQFSRLEQFQVSLPAQRTTLQRLRELANQKLDELALTISRRKTDGIESAAKTLRAGNEIMDQMRAIERDLEVTTNVRIQGDLMLAEHRIWEAFGGPALVLTALFLLFIWAHDVARMQASKAIEASHAKSIFLANMSHEFRTPLNAIIGYSGLLREQAQAKGEFSVLPDLEKIETSGSHLLALVNSILDLSRIEAGRMTVAVEDFEVTALIEQVRALAEPLMKKNHNRFRVDVAANAGVMHSDATKIRQCLLNLLGNAAKFTSKGEVRLEVHRSAEADGADVMSFMVSDTGIGMTADQRARVFEDYMQAETVRKYEGSGLGLAITRRFCRLLKGDIQVESAAGKGSSFTIRIPARISGEEAALGRPPLASQEPDRRKRVLIIDDDPDSRDLLQRAIQRDFATLMAAGGREGVDLVHTWRPDAILLDLLMPNVDGWDVLAALKSDPQTASIPVVIVSVSERDKGSLLAASDHLVKPIDRSLLLGALNRNIQNGSRLVLVVEDDSLTRETLRGELEREGWEVIETANGREGLEAVDHRHPAVIILDLLMDEVNGFEFIEELKTRPKPARDTPVVVMTAKDLTPDDRKRLNGRIFSVFRKSEYGLSDLAAKIGDIVRTIR